MIFDFFNNTDLEHLDLSLNSFICSEQVHWSLSYSQNCKWWKCYNHKSISYVMHHCKFLSGSKLLTGIPKFFFPTRWESFTGWPWQDRTTSPFRITSTNTISDLIFDIISPLKPLKIINIHGFNCNSFEQNLQQRFWLHLLGHRWWPRVLLCRLCYKVFSNPPLFQLKK